MQRLLGPPFGGAIWSKEKTMGRRRDLGWFKNVMPYVIDGIDIVGNLMHFLLLELMYFSQHIPKGCFDFTLKLHIIADGD